MTTEEVLSFVAGGVVAILIVVLFVVATGCGEDEPPPYTWGDVVDELSTEYCTAAHVCSGVEDLKEYEESIEQCAAHSAFHWCELEDTCDVELEDGSELSVESCVGALQALEYGSDQCWNLAFIGLFPEGCEDAVELYPEEE